MQDGPRTWRQRQRAFVSLDQVEPLGAEAADILHHCVGGEEGATQLSGVHLVFPGPIAPVEFVAALHSLRGGKASRNAADQNARLARRRLPPPFHLRTRTAAIRNSV